LPSTFTENWHELDVLMVAPASVTEFDPATAVIVPPPQEPVSPLGVETIRPEGSVSVNATPFSATLFVTGLVTVKVSLMLEPAKTLNAANDLPIAGGATTLSVAVAGAPGAAHSFEATVLVLLFLAPAVTPVTFRENEHDPPAGNEVSATVITPLSARILPLQVLVNPLGVEISNPVGKMSEKSISIREVVGFGFVIEKVSDVVPPSGMLGTPNALVRDGGPITVSVAVLLVAPGPDWVELIGPVVLLSSPAAVPVTFTVIVHDPLAESDAPLRLTVVPLAGAEKVPPQWFVAYGGLATFSPAGNGSENEMPLRL
jgi:hypothetical protein